MDIIKSIEHEQLKGKVPDIKVQPTNFFSKSNNRYFIAIVHKKTSKIEVNPKQLIKITSFLIFYNINNSLMFHVIRYSP